ncbi:ABC transporter substrate-binding protein [Aurantimonas aggregata]|uniref:ABC transporter substrate-binding protein n=1 Tax=Aurantimonas aggregata TaxID=2047720 RepID=A0A6L9MC23_9HYPH|nr:ABC transporter substrate-binding protein [Aurantimonas aggregata]NDV85369.1 ABC transporter substrate-binding protein [Aurantimonas aggregata]
MAASIAALGLLAVAELTGTTSFHTRSPRLATLFGPPDDRLRVVAVYSSDDDEKNFVRGARMAVDRLNEDEGGVLGRQVVLELVAEEAHSEDRALERTVSETLDLSHSIARTDNLLAVVGHEWSDTAVAASAVYSRGDVLYLATHATAQSLTNHNFQTVFALQPNNGTNAEMMANYALKNSLSRFIVLSDKTDYAKESANFFTAAATNAGGELVFRGYVSSSQRSNDQLLMFILENNAFARTDFDAIFVVSSSLAETADFITRARALGVRVPILGMEYMFSASIEKAVGKAAMLDVVGVSLYDPANISERAKAFSTAFRTEFGATPDLDAALGYDAVTLLGDVAKRAGTVEARAMADTMKVARYKASPFTGVSGPLLFDRTGLVTDTEVFIVRHDGEEFRAVANYKIPLQWDNVPSDHQKVDSGLPAALD